MLEITWKSLLFTEYRLFVLTLFDFLVQSPIFVKPLPELYSIHSILIFHFLSVVQHHFGLTKKKQRSAIFVFKFGFHGCFAFCNLKCTP